MIRIKLYLLSILILIIMNGLLKGTMLGIIAKTILFFLVGIPLIWVIGKLIINIIYSSIFPVYEFDFKDIKNFFKNRRRRKRL
jgi:hypothetical protein